MDFNNISFKLIGGNKGAKYSIQKSFEGEVAFVTVSMKNDVEEIPEQFSLEWFIPGEDCVFLWNPDARAHKLDTDWGPTKFDARLASHMPIQQVVSFTSRNKLLVAVSDVDTPTRISMGYSEEDADVMCRIDFFTVPTNQKSEYTATVRLDARDVMFYDSIYDAAAWWENECGYESAPVPDSARLPMDSLWYSFHQNLDAEEILRECKLSKELGMETVIIDDGWQTDDASRGYAYCGDWEVCERKMGDMKKLVQSIHEIGMKVILWYSVPFIGMYAKRYEEFKDYFLDGCGNAGTSFSLDPRYKKSRDFLVSIYEKAVKDWDLDGLKLDFIDKFKLKGKSLQYDARRDFQSLEDALHVLMGEIREKLTAIKEDILIEFRQSYVGPAIRKYGNMLRVGDCPGDILSNRSQIVNLRMTSGKTAVHSDMIMWNERDTVENAAMQFASVIFAVPQISMLIEKLPQEHVKMLKHYISFWKENRNLLIDGKLTAETIESGYSKAVSTLGDKEAIALYTERFAEIKQAESIVVNASAFENLIIKSEKEKSYTVINCMGQEVSNGKICASLTEIRVPRAGMIFLS